MKGYDFRTRKVPPLVEAMSEETGDYCELTLLDNIVTFRVAQIVDASPWELGLTIDDLKEGKASPALEEWAQIRAMIETAYRLGLKDGLVRLGDVQ